MTCVWIWKEESWIKIIITYNRRFKKEKNKKLRFLSLRFFGLLSSSLLLFPQRFGWYVLRPFSGVCRILNTFTRLWLTESEQATPVVSIKDVVRSSVKVPEFDKHLKKAGGHIGRNVVEITIKMKTIVRKTLMIKINKLRLRNLDN